MTDAILPPPKRIFIIGPMGKAASDADDLAISMHIPNIAAALSNVHRRFKTESKQTIPEVQVIEPPNTPGGDIPHGVFSHIMHCDFAVADISTQSPNVMYELAMLHANGVPVILLARDGQEIFYFNKSNCLEVDNFSIDTLADALTGRSFDEARSPGHFEQLLFSSHLKTHWNPITTHFDGVPLVNVAAATGIATGNFYNFTSWVLREGGIFRDKPEFEDIVLIKPSRIKDVDRAVGRLQQKFGKQKTRKEGDEIKKVFKEDGSPDLELPDLMFPEKDHPRGKYFVKYVGKHLVDYPTPISSLSVSRQFREFGRYIQENSDGLDDTEFPPFEQRLIDIYFKTLEDLASRDVTAKCDWGRVKILSVEEALDYLAE